MKLAIERLDHLGLIAGVMKDLHFTKRLDMLLDEYPDEEISAGEAIAGMVLCGLGFSDRPLSLTPQFFESRPIGYLLGRENIQASYFNHYKLGRILDRIYAYGPELLFAQISAGICSQEKINTRFGHLDTSSFSVQGEYKEQPEDADDAYAVQLNHGYSRDQRPDLKQVMLEVLVSGDGGIPLWSQCWDGNASDSKIFSERISQLKTCLSRHQQPKYLVADAKLYNEQNRHWLKEISFITRVPSNLNDVEAAILAAWQKNAWQPLENQDTFQ